MCQLSCVAHVGVWQKNLQRRHEPRDLSAATARPQKRAKSLQETLPPRRQETIVQTEGQAKGPVLPYCFFFWGGVLGSSQRKPRHRNARQVAPRNPVTKAARNFSADQVTSQGTFSLFFFLGGACASHE